MASRGFEAPDGTRWTVWEVIPGSVFGDCAPAGSRLPEGLEKGWLCFESAAEKRRLHPIPPRWEERSESEMWLMCRVGEPVHRHFPTTLEAESPSTPDSEPAAV